MFLYCILNMILFVLIGILNGSAPVMIPGSDNMSPQGNSPLGPNHGVGCVNDNRENVRYI